MSESGAGREGSSSSAHRFASRLFSNTAHGSLAALIVGGVSNGLAARRRNRSDSRDDTDTDGETKYCYNSAIATCRIQVAGKAFERAELTATRRAMFEILTDTRHETVPMLA